MKFEGMEVEAMEFEIMELAKRDSGYQNADVEMKVRTK